MGEDQKQTYIDRIKDTYRYDHQVLFWRLFQHARKIKLEMLVALLMMTFVFVAAITTFLILNSSNPLFLLIPLLPIFLSSFTALAFYIKGTKYLIRVRAEMSKLVKEGSQMNEQLRAIKLIKNNWFSLIKYKFKHNFNNQKE